VQPIFWARVETVIALLWKVSGISVFPKPLQIVGQCLQLQKRIFKCGIPVWYLYDREVGIVTRYGLDGLGFKPRREMMYLLQNRPDRLLGPTSRLLNGYRPRREVGHSAPPSAEDMNEWRYTSAPPAYVHGVDRDTTTFLPSPFDYEPNYCPIPRHRLNPWEAENRS